MGCRPASAGLRPAGRSRNADRPGARRWLRNRRAHPAGRLVRRRCPGRRCLTPRRRAGPRQGGRPRDGGAWQRPLRGRRRPEPAGSGPGLRHHHRQRAVPRLRRREPGPVRRQPGLGAAPGRPPVPDVLQRPPARGVRPAPGQPGRAARRLRRRLDDHRHPGRRLRDQPRRLRHRDRPGLAGHDQPG